MWPFKEKDGSRGKETEIDQHAKLACPRCKTIMKKIVRNGVIIDFCGMCHGMWLYHGELTKLIDMHESAHAGTHGSGDGSAGKHLKKKASPRRKR